MLGLIIFCCADRALKAGEQRGGNWKSSLHVRGLGVCLRPGYRDGTPCSSWRITVQATSLEYGKGQWV